MATDPVLDPTCGSGTTATVAEQWGRRWITIDTSRVALALARARIMGARYPFSDFLRIMNTLKSYQDLEVWQRSIELAERVYRLSAKFPAEEKFGLTSQVRRAAASVPANIAEGAEREGTKEFLQFLGIASGSLAETETFLILASRLGLVPEAEIHPALEQAGTVGRMLNGLKRSLRSKV